MTTPRKCIPLKNKWCGAIKKLADFGDPEASGLAVSQVVNVQDYTRGYGLRIGFPRKRWKELGGRMIWVNFCPFCGADVSERTKRKTKK